MSHSLDDDLLALMTRAWKLYRVLSKGPVQLQPLCTALLSMIAGLREIHEIISDHQISNVDEATLLNLNGRCEAVLSSAENNLKKLKSKETDILGLTNIQIQIEDQTNELSSVLEGLQERYSRQCLIRSLEQLLASRPQDQVQEITADWPILAKELHQPGLSSQSIDEEFFFINAFLEDKLLRFQDEEEEEQLPDYSPGRRPGTVAEKVKSLEQTTRLMSLSEEIVELVATSSKASPPPYTFESNADQDMDEELVKNIHRAIEQESRRRFLRHERSPTAGPQPYSWLPLDLQTRYSGVKYLAPLRADCFTVMAYETVPQCTEQIARLTNLFRVSFDHKLQVATEKVIQEAPATLKVLSIAISKFILLQDQRTANGSFSDLDSLEYEHSTILVESKTVSSFPHEEFELARKSYYNLLTYIMGMLHIFTDIFQGRTYLIRPPNELDFLWQDKKMASRTAWIEKQLTAWDKVENAVLHCRSLRALQPGLRDQAIKVLNDWKEAETILSGRSGDEMITLTVISVSGLPKPTLGQLSTFVRVVFYGPNILGGAYRLFDVKTDVSAKTQFPVWNKSFLMSVPEGARFVDLELYHRALGMDNYLGRRRLEFSFVPGVEATFANRSLMHGIDEEIDFPMKLATDAKGKGKAVMITVGLKWQGRFGRVEEMGLPSQPPGKMFRSDIVGIPV
ncbi:uncharacterized protein LY89DRAFT_748627 [Mollisia scopiformis]|uniref:C2 domain-containing protein n=1 Tax=Mollisia scopiformis TaxID=149040 RepID=A0A194X7K6_MOLSC|nr:uncharacterized protein LY89DRAFT_748627 [Mollisia scopiformis]KUJ16151.1 hypothetical protein LY89DRAFT_748627 [Mollisia scopiformis]